jgi:hypothetical protein
LKEQEMAQMIRNMRGSFRKRSFFKERDNFSVCKRQDNQANDENKIKRESDKKRIINNQLQNHV